MENMMEKQKESKQENIDEQEMAAVQEAAVPEEPLSNELLVEYRFSYTKEEAWKYRRYVKGPAIPKGTWIMCGVFVTAGLAFMIWRHNWILLLFCLLFAAVFAGLTYLIDRINITRYYKRTMPMWDQEARIRIYEENISVLTKEKETIYEYDDFYRIDDFADRIYMTAGSKHMVVIDKTKVPETITEAILELKKTEFGGN